MSRVSVGEPFLLSETGSTRATAYAMANKVVRVGDRTTAVWLDEVSTVKAATFDHARGAWSDAATVGIGKDNHASPALTAAPDGGLRLAYGPRSCEDPFSEAPMNAWAMGKFRIVRSASPGDGGAWLPLSHVGYAATYGSLVTDAQGRDHIVYNGGSAPPAARYERRLPDDSWDHDFKLMHQPVGHRYTHTGATLAVHGEAVFAAFHYYSSPRDTSLGVCAVRSDDGGASWRGLDGGACRLPLLCEARHAVPHAGDTAYLGSLATDAAGRLIAVTHDMGNANGGCFFSTHDGKRWNSTQLDSFLPPRTRVQSCNVTVASSNAILVVADVVSVDVTSVAARWNHPSTEVVLLWSRDEGRTFQCEQVSKPDARVANWLGNISRTGPNHDMRSSLVLYTQGVSGTGKACRDPERTRVYGVWIDA